MYLYYSLMCVEHISWCPNALAGHDVEVKIVLVWNVIWNRKRMIVQMCELLMSQWKYKLIYDVYQGWIGDRGEVYRGLVFWFLLTRGRVLFSWGGMWQNRLRWYDNDVFIMFMLATWIGWVTKMCYVLRFQEFINMCELSVLF